MISVDSVPLKGSIRQARHLLDLAHDMRTNEETTKQNLQALSLQRASLESLLARSRSSAANSAFRWGSIPRRS